MHVEDDEGKRLAKARLPEGVEGVARFHELVLGGVLNERGDWPVAGDSDLAEAVKLLARAQQGLVWTRRRQLRTHRQGGPATAANAPLELLRARGMSS